MNSSKQSAREPIVIRNNAPMQPDSGQAAISLVIMLGLFLLAMFGFAVDLTNVWFHRQAAQAAADSACEAGALDMLSANAGLTPPAQGFTVGTNGNCTSSSAATICSYAGYNGYTGSGLKTNAASNSVSWTFPSSVTGVTGAATTNSFLQVLISENVQTFFMGLLTLSHVQNINVQTTCGLAQVPEAAPMLVLSPSASGAFTYTGGGTLDIIGGPTRGLQVNSTSSTAISWGASAIINLSQGGPNQTGSDSAVVGGPTAIPSNGSSAGYSGGSTGSWKSGVLPVADPFGKVTAPSKPAAAPAPKWVQYGVDGCPDHSNNVYISNSQPNESCEEFSPGYYPSGLNITYDYVTAIFDPGVYYLNGNFTTGGSNTLRNASPPGTQVSDGVVLYFLSGSLNFSGGTSGNNIDTVPLTSLTCNGSAPPAALGLPSGGLSGNVLIAQCATNGTYFDSAGDTTDTRGTPGTRGLLVFQGHSDTSQPSFTGSGALAFSGALYFHSTSTSNPITLTLNGGASAGTYVLGEIVTDQVSLTGSGTIKLALNPSASTPEAKVAIFN